MSEEITEPTAEDYQWLFTFIEKFEEPGVVLRNPFEEDEEGFDEPDESDLLRKFIRGVHERNIIIDFDWVEWKDTVPFFENPELVKNISMTDCRKMLTAHVRANRFVGGYLAYSIEAGEVTSILRRMRDLC